MTSHYGVVFPEFWSGETGRAIRTSGGKDGQLIALYLMSCHNATMIGLYLMPVRDIYAETGIGQKGLARALGVLGGLGFADYDGRTEHVWVREMAKFRLGLQKRSPLDPDDKRVTGIQRLYDRLAENPFLEPFFDRYAKELRLKGKRRSGRSAEPLLDMGHRRGFDGPSKPVNRSTGTDNRDQVQGSGYRDQGSGYRDQGSGRSTVAVAPDCSKPVENLKRKPKASAGGVDGSEADRIPAVMRGESTDARRGLRDRRRRVESPDPGAPRAIGFHGVDAGSPGSGDVGDGARSGEGARAAAAAVVELTGASLERWPADPRGVAATPRAPEGARDDAGAADDGRTRPGRSEQDARADQPVASGTTAAVDRVDPDADRVGESPGQAQLRRTIEQLRRGYRR